MLPAGTEAPRGSTRGFESGDGPMTFARNRPMRVTASSAGLTRMGVASVTEKCRPASNCVETGSGIRACGRDVGAGSTDLIRPQEQGARAIASTMARKLPVLFRWGFMRLRTSRALAGLGKTVGTCALASSKIEPEQIASIDYTLSRLANFRVFRIIRPADSVRPRPVYQRKPALT